ncbi:hypothetical protein D3C80_988390 [compost metagenome]
MHHGGRLLDLRHEEGAILDQLTGFDDVFRALHEGQGHPVHAQLQAEVEVAAILGGQRRELQHGFGYVDALAVGQLAAGHHLGIHAVGLLGGHLQAQAAVVQQQVHARFQGFDDLGVGQVDPLGGTRGAVQVQAEGLAALEVDLAVGEAAHAQFRPLQVHEDADGVVQLALHLAHPLVALGVVGVFAVAEVQAEQVDAGLHQLADVVDAFDRRPEGGEDFHFLVRRHFSGLSRIRMARKSFTLVRVGSVTMRSPRAAKYPYPLLLSSSSLEESPCLAARA